MKAPLAQIDRIEFAVRTPDVCGLADDRRRCDDAAIRVEPPFDAGQMCYAGVLVDGRMRQVAAEHRGLNESDTAEQQIHAENLRAL